MEEEQRRVEEACTADRYRCWQCGKDMTGMDKSDGRAAELREVAIYWCEVYQVWHPATGRNAAIKMTLQMEEVRDLLRFLREISIMKDLVHPNIVRLYEAGTHKGNPFFVSEFVPGGDFLQFINRDGKPLLPPQEMVALFPKARSACPIATRKALSTAT